MKANNKPQDLMVTEDEAQLPDLALTDEELDGIKAGTGSEDGGGGRTGGDWVINHNETTVSDEEVKDQLPDLALTDEEMDGVKAGRGSEDGGGGMGGDWVLNHSETIVGDDEYEAQLADLVVSDEQADEISAGTGEPPVLTPDPGYRWNHNETILTDTLN